MSAGPMYIQASKSKTTATNVTAANDITVFLESEFMEPVLNVSNPTKLH